jgi:chromosome segregation ATPase
MLVVSILCVDGIDHVHSLDKNGKIEWHKNKFSLVLAIKSDIDNTKLDIETWLNNRTGKSIELEEVEVVEDPVEINQSADQINQSVDLDLDDIEEDHEKINERDRLVENLNNLRKELDALVVEDKNLVNSIAVLMGEIDDLKEKMRSLEGQKFERGIDFQYQDRIAGELLKQYHVNPDLDAVIKEIESSEGRLKDMLSEQEDIRNAINDLQEEINSIQATLKEINDELVRERQAKEEERQAKKKEQEEERKKLAEQNAIEEAQRKAAEAERRRINSIEFGDALRAAMGGSGFDGLYSKLQLMLAFRKYLNEMLNKIVKQLDLLSEYVEGLNEEHKFLDPYNLDMSDMKFDMFKFKDLDDFAEDGVIDFTKVFEQFIRDNQGKTIKDMHEMLDSLMDQFIDGGASSFLTNLEKIWNILMEVDRKFQLVS